MHSILHVSEMVIQDVVENLAQIFTLSKPLVRQSIIKVLEEHSESINDSLLNEIVEAVTNSNVFVSATAEGAELSFKLCLKIQIFLTRFKKLNHLHLECTCLMKMEHISKKIRCQQQES